VWCILKVIYPWNILKVRYCYCYTYTHNLISSLFLEPWLCFWDTFHNDATYIRLKSTCPTSLLLIKQRRWCPMWNYSLVIFLYWCYVDTQYSRFAMIGRCLLCGCAVILCGDCWNWFQVMHMVLVLILNIYN